MAGWLNSGIGGGGSGSTDTTDSTTDTTSTSSSLDSVKGVLLTFGRSPAGFILGIVLKPIFAGLDALVLGSLNLIGLVFDGTNPGTEGLLGVADVPAVVSGLVVDAGNIVGSATLTVVRTVVSAVVGPVADAGPLGMIVLALAFVVALNLYAGVLRKAAMVALDVVPGAGGLTK